ncbi:hypothetical protein GCM10009839_80100 [Catenulispora yoronensis]|uniref:NADH:ubiquinone oxidoreductase 30kDa subunit domain-containing protein n=1 Tax=Catenulispora yoronensis TaxID=450799 RepID=A0ABP5GVC2_9ACTN
MTEHEAETWSDVQETFGERTVTVAPEDWLAALERARDYGYTFFDWLSAVDEQDAGFDVFAHVAKIEGDEKATRLLIRTRIPQDKAVLPSAVGVYRGANWHERETAEMFGVAFTGHPNLIPLLLPDGFDGHPLRKDFVLAARVAKEWPGVKEPGEGGGGGSHGAAAATATATGAGAGAGAARGAAARGAAGGAAAGRAGGKPAATRRRMVPPGVPDGWLKPLPEAPQASSDARAGGGSEGRPEGRPETRPETGPEDDSAARQEGGA